MSDPKLRQNSPKSSRRGELKLQSISSSKSSKYELLEMRNSELNMQKVLSIANFIG